jgi:glycosyltransferase involved in cell wall biosynthesis
MAGGRRRVSAGTRFLIVPAYEEADRLGDVLDRVRECASGFEVVVIDDGSQDATSAVARSAGARVLRHSFNLGYGAALQTGYKYAHRAGAKLVVQMDADGQHDPAEIPGLCAPIENGELDLVVGSRFLDPGAYRMGTLRTAARKLFQSIARAFGLSVTDPTSGFQAMNRNTLDLYVEDLFPSDYPDVDVLIAAHRSGLRIGERSVVMSGSVRESTLHAGWAPVYYVYKMLLSLWVASSNSRRTRS